MSPFDVAAPAPGVMVEAVVKWFNSTKGFGFVAPADGTADAFLHMSVLSRAGLQQIAEGEKLLVEVGDGQKGRQVLRVVQDLGMSDTAFSSPAPHATYEGPVEEMTGTVKWFKNEKGFGFVAPDDGGKDIFVHKSVVLRAGLTMLEPGQKLLLKIHTASKGREATEISPA